MPPPSAGSATTTAVDFATIVNFPTSTPPALAQQIAAGINADTVAGDAVLFAPTVPASTTVAGATYVVANGAAAATVVGGSRTASVIGGSAGTVFLGSGAVTTT